MHSTSSFARRPTTPDGTTTGAGAKAAALAVLRKPSRDRTPAQQRLVWEWLQTDPMTRPLFTAPPGVNTQAESSEGGVPVWRLLCESLDLVSMPTGTLVYRQGDDANCFYLILEGSLEVWHRPAKAPRPSKVGIATEFGARVTRDEDWALLGVRVGTMRAGQTFGELLRTDTSDAARPTRWSSIVSLGGVEGTEHAVLLRVTGSASDPFLKQRLDALAGVLLSRVNFLSHIRAFSTWPHQDLEFLAYLMRENKVAAGAKLYQQGDDTISAYFVRSGLVEIRANGLKPSAPQLVLEQVEPHRWFGDMELWKPLRESQLADENEKDVTLEDIPRERDATAVALETTTVLELPVDLLDRLVFSDEPASLYGSHEEFRRYALFRMQWYSCRTKSLKAADEERVSYQFLHRLQRVYIPSCTLSGSTHNAAPKERKFLAQMGLELMARSFGDLKRAAPGAVGAPAPAPAPVPAPAPSRGDRLRQLRAEAGVAEAATPTGSHRHGEDWNVPHPQDLPRHVRRQQSAEKAVSKIVKAVHSITRMVKQAKATSPQRFQKPTAAKPAPPSLTVDPDVKVDRRVRAENMEESPLVGGLTPRGTFEPVATRPSRSSTVRRLHSVRVQRLASNRWTGSASTDDGSFDSVSSASFYDASPGVAASQVGGVSPAAPAAPVAALPPTETVSAPPSRMGGPPPPASLPPIRFAIKRESVPRRPSGNLGSLNKSGSAVLTTATTTITPMPGDRHRSFSLEEPSDASDMASSRRSSMPPITSSSTVATSTPLAPQAPAGPPTRRPSVLASSGMRLFGAGMNGARAVADRI